MLFLFGFFFLDELAAMLLELIKEGRVLTLHLHQLFEVQLLVQVHFDGELVNQLLQLLFSLPGQLGLLWSLLERVSLFIFLNIFQLLHVLYIAPQAPIFVIKF